MTDAVYRRRQARDVLCHSGLFSHIDDALLEDMLTRFQPEIWARGRTVPAEEVKDRFHVIVSGRLQVVKINQETGRIVTLFLLGPGDAFDLLQLLTDQPCEGIFEARDNLDILSLPIDAARRWISEHPEFNRAFLPYLGHQMRALSQLAGDLALHDTETRLAHLIMRHLDQDEHGVPRITLINDLSHEVLAEMIGSVRAVVNRQLQHWRKAEIITLDHGHIRINKLESLIERVKRFQLPAPKPGK